MYILSQRHHFPVPPGVIWDFIQDPANLDDITPPDLRFTIVSEVPAIMYDGLIIEYRLQVPVFGKQSWVTEIKHIRPGQSFVDEQRLGPYRFWYHYHEVRPEEGGAAMLDRVHYRLPGGPLGSLLHQLIVRRTLARIFEFRRQRLATLFGAGDLLCVPPC
ncbi:SRPBCC family protein [Desulfofustis limnaeus]|uniref:SRPBCC domain-containing protein n=1 Tax=Desulfofustis limnaeus TaxID=2740163 RepID=A0ABM7W610_9BACT|nr:SRPBCC family protein [Desulfofustis limnaeus]MDX9895417.1 SRPBCC family protein [Desulfofustis sp.]BDD86321.1 SRPBCC domain-containing protein [Desulfofustis limnaeus]